MIRWQRRLEIQAWNAVPALLTLFLAIVYLIPKHLSGLSSFMPVLTLMPVFFWGMKNTHEMPYWFVFALGLLADAATGQPLGFSSLLYMFFLGVVHAQRKYMHKEGFVIKWGYFGLLMAINQIIAWLMLSIVIGQRLAIGPVLLQWILTVCFYPLMHKGFDGLNTLIQQRRWRLVHGM